MPDPSRTSPASASSARRLARVVWVWGPALLVMATIFFLSNLTDLPALPGDVSDKTGHFWGYFLLGICVLRGTARARWSGVSWGTASAAWLICAVYGASDEWHQTFVVGRVGAFDDWIADVTGAATAVAVVGVVAVLRRRRQPTV